MTAKPSYRWHRLRAGAHTMMAWIGDAQCTYVAVRHETGWVLTRHVAGAATIVAWAPTATLRAARTLAAQDVDTGLL